MPISGIAGGMERRCCSSGAKSEKKSFPRILPENLLSMSKNTFNQINLRLKTLYDMIPECARMGDVGTDHGYLPIYCIQTANAALPSPLTFEKGLCRQQGTNIAAYGLEDRIETLLCSGLDGYRDRLATSS